VRKSIPPIVLSVTTTPTEIRTRYGEGGAGLDP
jgi:hypothetical protein